MIAKITKGRALKSLAAYLLHGSNNESPNRGQVLATNFAGSDIRSWSREFAAFRRLRAGLARAVAHISLNLSPEERPLSDEEFIEIATRFKAGMGYTDDCPFLLVRHRDCDHQHVHLVLSRISLTGVVPETNDFRKAEKLAAALRAEFNLKGPADTKKKKQEADMATSKAEERAKRLEEYALGRLEEISVDGDNKLAAVSQPDAPSIEFSGPLTVKEEREFRREAVSDDYQKMMQAMFEEQLRYIRKTAKGLTMYFHDGARLHDSGSRIVCYNATSPAIAAQRLMEVAAMKGWDTGFVVRGSDELLRYAAIIAVRRNLPIVALDAHQLAIITAVRDSMQDAGAVVAAVPPSPLPPPASPSRILPTSTMTGRKGLGGRLRNRRLSEDEEGGDDYDGGTRPSLPRPR